MRRAAILYNGRLAGTLTQLNATGYVFRYADDWYANPSLPAVSLRLPKTSQTHRSDHLFPFFFHLLAEGVNKALQCRQLKIDPDDHFGLLLATAFDDTVGAVTVQPISEP